MADGKYDGDKIYEYEKIIEEKEKRKSEIQEQLDTLKEVMAGLLFEFSTTLDPLKERQINDKAEEEKQLLVEYDNALKDQRKAMLSWRKRLAAHYEKGHKITKSRILPAAGVGASSFVATEWEGKIIPFKDITFYKDKKLGEGAFGTVYRGMVYGNIVAIKRLKEPVNENVKAEVSRSNVMISFENEIGILGGLKHPNILGFMGASFLNDEENKEGESKFLNCCILTEFAEKGSLHDILYSSPRDGGLRVKFTVTRKFTAVGQIVEGMTHLHSKGILHLDLKPANILLDGEYNVKIADFGMSRISASFATSLQNFIGGTPYYMAPEILFADDPSRPSILEGLKPTPKSDVFSFGILLNEFLNEEPPYSEMIGSSKPTIDDLKKIVRREGELSRPPIYKEKQEEIKKLIESCWQLNPEDRKSFQEMLKECAWIGAKNALVTDSSAIGNKILTSIQKVQKDSKIKFDDFIKILKDHHGLETELHKNNINNQQAVSLFLDVPNRVTQPNVELVKISRFLTWFEGYKSTEIILAIQQIVKTKWFFGALDETQAREILSKKENLHTGTFLVRWDNDEFVLSFIYSDKEKEKFKESGGAQRIAHVSTNSKTVKDLFENESVWKQKYNLKTSNSPDRPLAYQNLEGIWFKSSSYVSSGTSYTSKIEGVNPAAPTQQEQLNQQRGLPSFDMVL